MYTEQIILISSIRAAETLTKNRFVSFDGHVAAADSVPFGVVNADTYQNGLAPVAVSGIALVETSESIAVGDAVSVASNGKCKVANTTIVGYALDSASAGALIRVLLK